MIPIRFYLVAATCHWSLAAQGTCNAAPGGRCVHVSGQNKGACTRDDLLIQTQTQRTKRLAVTDASVATHIKAFSSNVANVASVVQSGINAILAAVVHFSSEPPQIAVGISELGVKLFESLELLLSEEHRSTEEFRAIRTQWLETFEAIPDTIESVKHDLQLFVEDGDTKALVRGIITIVNEAGQIVGVSLPATGDEIMKYLNAISEAFETIGGGWGDFFQGNTIQGIEGIYGGLKLVAESILPADIQNSDAFDEFVGKMDQVVGMISNTVLDYERRILEANVCWRSEHSRIRQRPRVCEDGFRWDGQQSCTKVSSLLSHTSSKSFDSTLSAKGGNAGTVPAHCNEASEFDEKYNHWCYGDCEPGFHAKDNTKCITTCAGTFSSESGYLCGRDPAVLVKAQVEMVTVVINGLFELHDAIQKIKDDGINGDTLTSTIQVFIDMGKPFAKPNCPIVTPPATPAPPTLAVATTPETQSFPAQAPTHAGLVVSAGRHWHDKSGGMYFYADDTSFEGLEYPWWGGPVHAEQYRNGEMIWSGNVKIWQGTNGLQEDPPCSQCNMHGRREWWPESDQWKRGDVVYIPSLMA